MARILTTVYRAGTSFARGTTIDPLLSDEDVAILYERWDRKGWAEPLQFQGGSEAITCDMVCAVPLTDLVKAYGKSRTERLLQAATPYKEV